MENNSQQLELFSGSGKAPETVNTGRDKFFGHIRGYEKTIFVAIGFIVTAVIAFSLGAERGKRLTLETSAPAPIIKPTPTVKPIPPAIKQEAQIVPLVQNAQPGNYTIQLASFQNKALAQKEAAALKKKGLAALLVSKGSYNIVCVGSFSSKESAKTLLTELRKKYQDSFIRRL
jgi:hypothetical protein